jgi:hypothetical protein
MHVWKFHAREPGDLGAGSTIGLGCRAALLTAVPGLAAEGGGEAAQQPPGVRGPSRSMPIPASRLGRSINHPHRHVPLERTTDSVGPVQTSAPRRRRALRGNGSLAWYLCQSVRSGLIARVIVANRGEHRQAERIARLLPGRGTTSHPPAAALRRVLGDSGCR